MDNLLEYARVHQADSSACAHMFKVRHHMVTTMWCFPYAPYVQNVATPYGGRAHTKHLRKLKIKIKN